MKLITKAQMDELRKAGVAMGIDEDGPMPKPVVKLFTPDANATWLLAWLEEEDEDVAFGLCDLGMGCPEMGTVRLSELAALRGPMGLPVERDMYFTPEKSLLEYANDARKAGRIAA